MKKFFNNLKEKANKAGKGKTIAIIIVAILLIIIIPITIKSIATSESPIQVIADVVTKNDKKIIGKWQGDEGVTAYEFYNNGKYDSYISTFKYSGKYEIKGNKLTLKNSSMTGTVTYKVSISSSKLSLKLIEENDQKSDDKVKTSFSKVDKITMQSFSDILDELTTSPND